MDWYTSGWAVEPVANNDNFIWIRTPYTPEYFKNFAPIANELGNIRVNAEGTIDIQYMAKIGDTACLIGNRPVKTAPKNPTAPKAAVDRLKMELTTDCQTGASIVNTGINGLSRLHETRVQISSQAGEQQMAYIMADHRITDVVVAPAMDGAAPIARDSVDALYDITRIVRHLRNIPHVNAVRLRSMKLATAPDAYTRAVINTLGDLNHLSVVNPLRLEIETWFVRAEDVDDAHGKLVRRLNNKGITVYANVPLLGGVNDTDRAVHDLAYALRKTGIEFHHLYVAGLPVQNRWNKNFPIDSYDVIDIATMVRREGSGREIPRYIILTALGEVDYGLTAQFVKTGKQVKIKLGCYDQSYYTSMDKHFVFPEGIDTGTDGSPVVTVSGLIKTNDFPVS
jgi:hypothetical protein